MPRLHVSQFDVQDGSALRRLLDVVILDDPVRSVERNDHAFLEIPCHDHRDTPSMSLSIASDRRFTDGLRPVTPEIFSRFISLTCPLSVHKS